MLTTPSSGKIFINYRRGDTRGEAGRLMDTLTGYLGEGRVFRDIEGIAGGEDFEHVLNESVGAADAVIVLIGPNWLTATDAQGQRRLDDPEDWVAREIASALEKKLPIFPVLVEDAQMPHADELPESLKGLVRYNAVNLSDKRWNFDVTRLAKVIAFDLPGSVIEQRLNLVRMVSTLALFIATALTTGIVSLQAGQTPLLELWQSGLSYIAIVGVSVLLLVYARLLDETRRKYFYLAGISGLSGTLLFYIMLYFIPDAQEPVAAFFGSNVVISLMFVFMCFAGFKAR